MPIVCFTHAELAALQAVFKNAEQVDWEAYDAAKAVVLAHPGTEVEEDEEERAKMG